MDKEKSPNAGNHRMTIGGKKMMFAIGFVATMLYVVKKTLEASVKDVQKRLSYE